MGAGIAQVSIDKGYSTILKDATEAGLVRGHNQISKNFQTGVKRKRYSKYVFYNIAIMLCCVLCMYLISNFLHSADVEKFLSNLAIQVDYKNFDKVDMVIEAVFEDIDLKHR